MVSSQKNAHDDEQNVENEEKFLVDDLELEGRSGEPKSKKKQKDSDHEETREFSKTKIDLLRKLLLSQKQSIDKMIDLLSGVMSENEARISIGQMSEKQDDESGDENGQIIEGVFDGESMIGPDGKQYSIPANYASKSKLVEGDILKLTITANGTFVYKQIGPIERGRVIGILEQAANGNFTVRSEDKSWRVLTASVTYFKGQNGDEVVILVPKVGESKWAAVENIVKQ
jgi:hypothetical protein